MSGILFCDSFVLHDIDLDTVTGVKEKKFDKVSRIDAKSENYDTQVTLDINSEIYPMQENSRFELLLTDRLYDDAMDASDMPGYDASKPLDRRAEMYEYIMHGKIFKYAEERARAYLLVRCECDSVVYASFGGLLMALKGEARIVTSHSFKVDSDLYLFIRRL